MPPGAGKADKGEVPRGDSSNSKDTNRSSPSRDKQKKRRS